MSTDELLPLLDSDPTLFLLDVREPDEVSDWQIRGAYNIPLEQLASRVAEVPANGRIVVICAKGTRARQGAKILATRAISSAVLEGGMGSWTSTYDQVTDDFGGARVVQIRRRGKGCLSYAVGAGANCVVIDPSLDLDQYLDTAQRYGWTITHVLDTHLHADHISGARALADATGAVLMLSPADPFLFDFEPLSDGLVIELALGVHLSVSAVSVPGHTEGSTMYQLDGLAIFTGDTLFLESVGRPDLAEQAEPFAHHLYRSLHERVLTQSDEIMVFPAHFGAGVEVRGDQFVSRRLGSLRTTLDALKLNENDFVTWAVANVKDRPPNYQRIVRINSGQESVTAESAEVEMGPNRCAIA